MQSAVLWRSRLMPAYRLLLPFELRPIVRDIIEIAIVSIDANAEWLWRTHAHRRRQMKAPKPARQLPRAARHNSMPGIEQAQGSLAAEIANDEWRRSIHNTVVCQPAEGVCNPEVPVPRRSRKTHSQSVVRTVAARLKLFNLLELRVGTEWTQRGESRPQHARSFAVD